MSNMNQIRIIVIAGTVILTSLVAYHTWPKHVLTAQERCVQEYSKTDNPFNFMVLNTCKYAKD